MQSWGRWLSRGLVVGGLVWLVVIAYRYGSFVSVFGDTPCERDPARCDDRANLLAQRELGRWFLAAGVVLVVGFAATATRRWLAPRPEGGHGRGAAAFASIAVVALTAFAIGAGSVLVVVLTFVFWLFGGTAVYVAVLATWFVVLTWLLDRSHRRRATGDGDLGSLLVSGAAAATGIAVGCVAAIALAPLAGKVSGASLFLLVPVVLALGAGVGTAALVVSEHLLARRWSRRGSGATSRVAAAPVAVAVSVALVASALVVGTPVGRDLAIGIRSDLHPDLTPAVAGSVAPVLPDPRPDLTFIQPPAPTQTPTPTVVAGRPCTDADLTLAAQGWDSAMGSTAVSIVATNSSATACWVKGYPVVRLAQGGADLDLVVTRSATQRWGNGDVVPDRRIGIAAGGGRASFDLWWKGYRAAADQRTPQSLTVTLPGSAPLELGLATPYLLDVVQDAEVTVMRWTVPTPGSG